MNARPDYDNYTSPEDFAGYDTHDRSTGSLLREVMREVPALVGKELSLARAEMRESMEQTRRAATTVSAGGVVLMGGYIVLLLAAVYALSLVLLPWAAALVVGGIAAIAGYAMVKSGINSLKANELKPDRTLDSLHRDVDAIRRARHEYH